MGFKSMKLYASALRANASAVEDELQRTLNLLPLGERLWRCVLNAGISGTPREEAECLQGLDKCYEENWREEPQRSYVASSLKGLYTA